MKKLTLFILIITPFILLAGCTPKEAPETAVDEIDKTKEVVMDESESDKMMEKDMMKEDVMMIEVDEPMIKEMQEMTYDYSGKLFDVSGGSASGEAMATFASGAYSLNATFADLPDPEGTDFYEGWIVRRGIRFSVLSTGVAEKVDGVYTNLYSSGEDLTDHDFYVLTIEPDDGDPAPAAHVLEGVMKLVE